MQLSTLLFLAIAPVAQAPSEADLIKAMPADASIVVRVRGLGAVGEDVIAMVRAMDPEAARTIEPIIQNVADEVTRGLGNPDGQTPAIVLVQLPEPGGELAPPTAVAAFPTRDYQKALASISDGQVDPESRPGGYDAITRPDDITFFAVEKDGWMAVGTDEDLIEQIASGPSETLDSAIPPGLAEVMNGGDIGVFVDLKTLAERYADQIARAREDAEEFFEGLEDVGIDIGEPARQFYDQLFVAAKNAKGFAANGEFAEEGLTVDSKLAMADGYEPAGLLADLGTAATPTLETLPADAAIYGFEIADANLAQGGLFGQSWSIEDMDLELARAIGIRGLLESPDLKSARDQLREVGRHSISASTSLVDEGIRGITVVEADGGVDALVGAVRSASEAMGSSDVAFVEQWQVKPEDQSYEGFTFDRIDATFDWEGYTKRLAGLEVRIVAPGDAGTRPSGNPADEDELAAARRAAEVLRAVIGKKAVAWFGSDGERALFVAAADWDEAKSRLDAFLADQKGIGTTESYRSIRGRFPEQVTALYLGNAPAILRQATRQAREISGDEQVRVPESAPEGPALFGVSFVAEDDGLRFRGVLPSNVGPVISEGLVPLIERIVQNQQGN